MLLQKWKTLSCFHFDLVLQWNWFVVSLSDQHQVLVVYLIPLLSFHNNLWNNHSPANQHLCNDLPHLLQVFEWFHMLLNHFILADQKSFFPSIITLSFFVSTVAKQNIACNFFDVHHFQMIKQNVYLLSENLDQLSGLYTGFVYISLVLIDIYSS